MSIKLPSNVTMGGNSIKTWGTAETIFLSKLPSHVSVARISKGGYSSMHLHKNNWNRFHVVTGVLEIEIWKNENIEGVVLNKGLTLDIPPNTTHRMRAVEDCDIIEIYWSDDGELYPEDIERFDNGGNIKQSSPSSQIFTTMY